MMGINKHLIYASPFMLHINILVIYFTIDGKITVLQQASFFGFRFLTWATGSSVLGLFSI